MSCLPKPVLRGHMKRYGIKSILGGLITGSIVGGLYYFFVAVPRKNAYINFLKTYDAEAHFKDMVAWGYIQTVKEEKEKQ